MEAGKTLRNKSVLKSLNPCFDENGILRVGGQLQNAKLAYDQNQQIILPTKNKLIYLILEYSHNKYLYIRPKKLLYYTVQIFWPISGRKLAIKVVHSYISSLHI